MGKQLEVKQLSGENQPEGAPFGSADGSDEEISDEPHYDKEVAEADFWGKRGPPRHERQTIVWQNIAIQIVLHCIAFYGVWLLPSCKWQTLLWSLYWYITGGIGVTAGAHRLW